MIIDNLIVDKLLDYRSGKSTIASLSPIRNMNQKLTLVTDIVAYVKDQPHNVFYIVFVGENKMRRAANIDEQFTAEEKGQIALYMEEILRF
jgi:hypothetical protein